MTLLILISGDEPDLSPELSRIATAVRVAATSGAPTLTTSAGAVALDALSTPAKIAVARTPEAEAVMEALNNHLAMQGLPRAPVARLDAAGAAPHAPLDGAAILSAALVTAHEVAADNARLRGEAARTRTMLEARLEERFALERFIERHRLAGRVNTATLQPAPALSPITVPPGGTVTQRLTVPSNGLSDIAIHRPEGRGETDGVLSLTLSTEEDGEDVGHWAVDCRRLAAGWTRFARAAGLGTDAMTPRLTLHWQGTAPLALSAAVKHPEMRMQAHVNGKGSGAVLACRTWATVEGCAAPLTEGALLADASEPEWRTLPADVLATVEPLNRDGSKCLYREKMNVVQVHVLPDTVAIGRLPGAIAAGTQRLSARAVTRADEGPVADYAIGVALPSARPEVLDTEPRFAVNHATPWLTLGPREEAALDLLLPAPTRERHDLYLMTRLHGSNRSIVHGWTTFDRIAVSRVSR